MTFPSMLEYSHHLIKERVNRGDIVVDATLGNGYDTEFLANIVGEKGKVYGFDIQKKAIDNTNKRLKENNLDKQVITILDSHENIKNWVKEPIKAAMFNLGYLPKAEKTIKTNYQSTIEAINQLLDLIVVSGVITIVIYIEHDNGNEASKVEEFIMALPQRNFSVIKYENINQINYPPYLIAIEKI